MVTLRREMTRDTRRNDYDNRSSHKLYRDESNNSALRVNDSERERKNVSPEYLDYLWEELNRTEARRTLRPEEYVRGGAPEAIADTRIREDNRTSERYERSYSPAKETRYSRNGKLDKKGVVAIVAYFLIVAVIATLIIINGGNNAALVVASGTQAEISLQAGAEINSTTELPLISEESLDVMVLNDGSVVDINLLNKSESYTYQEKTNWFDKICDTISFIAGG